MIRNAIKSLDARKTMRNDVQALATLTHTWNVYEDLLNLIYWDFEVMAPARGAARHTEFFGFITQKQAESFGDPRVGEAIAAIEQRGTENLTEIERGVLREAKEVYARATRVPPTLQREIMETAGAATVVWREARKNNDFASFEPHLAKIVELTRKKAAAIDATRDPYEVILQTFDSSLTIERVDALFAEIIPQLKEIMQTHAKKTPSPELAKEIPVATQQAFNETFVQELGLDKKDSRIDVSTHPMSFWVGDSRITTRYTTTWWNALEGTAHEAGHALYELAIDRALPGSINQANTLVIHESQSRFFENHILKTQAYARYLVPKINKAYGLALTAEELFQSTHNVAPSLIRVGADEVTYPFHVFLRYELEKKLVRGELAVRDVPQEWNRMMRELLGVEPKTDTEGCLQDVHWAQASLGYFCTYVLGSVFAAQLEEQLRTVDPRFEEYLTTGQLEPIRVWLRENVQKSGRTFTSYELIERSTGKPLSAKSYMSYLKNIYL